MKTSQSVTIQKTRAEKRLSDIEHSFSSYVDVFETNPTAWWWAMEALRCGRASLTNAERGKLLLYSPEYVNNAYQRNIYSESERFSYEILPVNQLVLDEQLVHATFSKQLVFHQHWLKNIYWKSVSRDAGIAGIDRHIGILKALKAFGATICWSLHNLVDHDANGLQETLNDYAIGQMAQVCDHIFIHTRGAGEMLSAQCGLDLSSTFQVLEHPLYDDLLDSVEPCLPEEIKKQSLAGRRILLCVGMIRPYKGVPDLLRAFELVVKERKNHGLHLIIAGELQDPEVSEVLRSMDSQSRSCISLVARRLRDDELAGLMQLAHAAVVSYTKILTSGSYFLATTFGKPLLAPRRGMFAEVVKDGETGFLYDGSVNDLVAALHRVAACPDADLIRVGECALQSCNHLTISRVSTRFFSILEDAE